MGAFDEEGIIISLDSVGQVSVRELTVGDTNYLAEVVAKKGISDKAFVQAILLHQVVTSTNAQEEFNRISDEDLLKVARAFLEAEKDTFTDYTAETEMTFASFRKVVTDWIAEEEKRVLKFMGVSKEYLERLANTVARIDIPKIDVRVLRLWKRGGFPETLQSLNGVLENLARVDLPQLQYGIYITEPVRAYWKDFYALNEKITSSVFAILAAQTLFPQRSFASELREVSQLSIKNEQVFAERIQEVRGYPEQHRDELYRQAGIQIFSVEEFEALLQKIKKIIERYSQLIFWDSRTRSRPAKNLERIAQGHMMGLIEMGLPHKTVIGFQQLRSGSGIIDILLVFANEYGEQQKIILELKVFKEGHLLSDGIEQTAQYMENEETENGYRVIFNAKKEELEVRDGPANNKKVVKDIVININLPPPSSLDKKKPREK